MLTQEQITQLYDFCAANGVDHYDMQVELVDHLANAIERKMAGHPEWSFEDALYVVFASFGPRKFELLMEEKRKAAQLYCRRLFWSVFQEQLNWPGTWIVLVALYYGYVRLEAYTFVPHMQTFNLFVLHLLSGIAVILAVRFGNRQLALLSERTHKKFMLVNMSHVTWLCPMGFMLIWVLYMFRPWQAGVVWIPIERFIVVLIFIYGLSGLAYIRTMLRLKGKIMHDFKLTFYR